MNNILESLVELGKSKSASDLHLEPGLPAVFRIKGNLVFHGKQIDADDLLTISRSIIGPENWSSFRAQRSFDLSGNISGIRCRINILQTYRGVGLAIRLLSSFQPTLENLNLHPDLKKIRHRLNGLVLVSGPTGSGKSSTMAALINEIDQAESKHIITIEHPIEYHFQAIRSVIRQREVGRDTPSFSQGLVDAMREDPDVLMIGEMREPDIMRLTLNAAETGHLVLATMHSASVVETLQRVVSVFPAEIQNSVRAQIADCLFAVVCQRLIFKPELKIRVPVCEILFENLAVKSIVRSGKFFKLNDVLHTSASDSMWSLSRYEEWINGRKDWYIPDQKTIRQPEKTDKKIEQKIEEKLSVPVNPSRSGQHHIHPKAKIPNNSDGHNNGVSPKKECYEIDGEEVDNIDDILKELDTGNKGGTR